MVMGSNRQKHIIPLINLLTTINPPYFHFWVAWDWFDFTIPHFRLRWTPIGDKYFWSLLKRNTPGQN
jgi:hypothetical protein